MDLPNILLTRHKIPKAIVQNIDSATHWLLFPAVGAFGGAEPRKGWKTFEGFHEKNPRVEGAELLAEAWKASNELRTEKAGEIPNHLCVENNP